jgi:PAP2 superfamily
MRAIILAGISQLALATAAFADNAVTRANENMGLAMIASCQSPSGNPFHESRAYAMANLAIHDALNAIQSKYQPYAYDKKAEAGTSANAAVASAAYHVMAPTVAKIPTEVLPSPKCLEDAKAVIEGAYAMALVVIPAGTDMEKAAKDKGIALGKAAAEAVLAKRANDHADDGGPFINKTCPSPGDPGRYQCTPGAPFVAFEKWENVTPFVLKDHTEFRPGPPYKVDDTKFKAELEEVKKLGGDGKSMPTNRTPDQAEAGLFWLESSPLKWGRIAYTVANDKGLDLWESARLMAILQMGLSDGYLAMVSAKNHYQFWRPVTAIQASGDKNWMPYQKTPPNQDYPSGHSIEGGVGAEVLKRFFGTDQVSFKDCGATMEPGHTCWDEKPTMRSFTTFTQAADENAASRIYIGFHFRNATVEGTNYGRKIGERAATLLPPVK